MPWRPMWAIRSSGQRNSSICTASFYAGSLRRPSNTGLSGEAPTLAPASSAPPRCCTAPHLVLFQLDRPSRADAVEGVAGVADPPVSVAQVAVDAATPGD